MEQTNQTSAKTKKIKQILKTVNMLQEEEKINR